MTPKENYRLLVVELLGYSLNLTPSQIKEIVKSYLGLEEYQKLLKMSNEMKVKE